MSTATRLFGGLSLLVGVAVVVVVAVAVYAVYLRPPDPPPGTATIEVTGTPGTRFEGSIWTLTSGWQRHIEGEVPRTFNVTYVPDDSPPSSIIPAMKVCKAEEQPEGTPSTLKVAVRVNGGAVGEGQTRAGARCVNGMSGPDSPGLKP